MSRFPNRPCPAAILLALAFAVVLCAPGARAAADDPDGELGVMVGLHRIEADMAGGKVSTSPTVGLRVASRLSSKFNWFLDGTYTSFELPVTTDNASVTEGRGGLERIFHTKSDYFSWYLAGAFGAADVENPGAIEDFSRPLVSLGVGLRQNSGRGLWRAEVRAEQLLGDDGVGGKDITNVQFLIGWSFGLRSEGRELFAPGKQTLVLEGVNFELDSDKLTRESYTVLNRVAKKLRVRPEVNVEVSGYTDSLYTPEYNLDLSERRANTVRNYLISKGIAPSRLTAKGYGETHPVGSNATEAGRARNRRVELKKLD